MPQDAKYNLSAPTAEEQDAFMKEFNALVEKHSMYFEPVPFMQRKSLTDPWEVSAQIFLQKKTLATQEDVLSPIQNVEPPAETA